LKVLKPAGDIVVWAGIGVNLRIGGGTKAAGTGTGGRIRDRGRDRDRGGDGDRGGDRGQGQEDDCAVFSRIWS